jgi:hypothetical protein
MVEIPRHTNAGYQNSNRKPQVETNKNTETNGISSGAPKMKGNIGPAKKQAYIDGEEVDQRQKHILRKMAEEFDIDNVIPQAEQMAVTPDIPAIKSEKSFDLSMEDYEINSHQSRSPDKNFGPANTMGKGFSGIPGLE